MGEWQPIETAPRNGLPILCAHKDGFVNILKYTENASDLSEPNWRESMFSEKTWNPAHWMPLPEPPEEG